jgi:hypothetical protein
MNKSIGIGQELHEGSNYPSPFTKLLGLGYYDGPTNGLLLEGQDGRVYKFDLLDELYNSEGIDLRIFSLAALPSEAFDQLVDALCRYKTPHWPVWVPIWQFPTPDVREAIDRVTNQVLQQAGAIQWVVAAFDLLEEIVAARPASVHNVEQEKDWFSFLSVDKGKATKKSTP